MCVCLQGTHPRASTHSGSTSVGIGGGGGHGTGSLIPADWCWPGPLSYRGTPKVGLPAAGDPNSQPIPPPSLVSLMWVGGGGPPTSFVQPAIFLPAEAAPPPDIERPWCWRRKPRTKADASLLRTAPIIGNPETNAYGTNRVDGPWIQAAGV